MRTSTDRTVQAAGAALAWVNGVLDRLPPEGAARLALQAGAAAALCADVAPVHTADARGVLRRSRECHRQALAGGDACGSWSVLLLGAVADRAAFGRLAPELAAPARDAADALRELPAAQRREGYLAPWMLLARLRRLPPPRPRPGTMAERDWLHLLQDDETARLVATEVELRSAYGTVALHAPPELARVLEPLLYCRMRDYHLERACTLARALAYLGCRDTRALREARHFLLTNQDEDGSFGFLDRETARLARDAPGPGPALRLKLTVTLGALWALAETDGTEYRLFRDMGGAFARLRPRGTPSSFDHQEAHEPVAQ